MQERKQLIPDIETARKWAEQIPVSERRRMLTIVTELQNSNRFFDEWRSDLLKEMRDEGSLEADSTLYSMLHGMEKFEEVKKVLYDK